MFGSDSPPDGDRLPIGGQSALELAARLGQVRQQGIYNGNLGQAYLDLGRAREALAACDRAYELSAEVQNRRGQAIGLLCTASAHLALEQHEQAATGFAEAERLSRQSGDRNTLAEASVGLAELSRRNGDLPYAIERVESAIGIIESVRTAVDIQRMRASFLANYKSYYDLQIELLMELAGDEPDGQYAAEALRVSERARARSLLELLAEAVPDMRADLDPDLQQRERKLLEDINALASKRLRDRSSLEALQAELDEIERSIRRSHPRYAQLAYAPPLDLDAIQTSVLDETSLLLEYSLGDRRSYLWVVGANRFDVFELPSRETIEAKSQRVYELLTDAKAWYGEDWEQHRKMYRREALELSKLLLGPIVHALDGQALVIVAEGALSYIPFAALPNPAGILPDPEPLVVGHEVVNVPSVSVLSAIRARQSPSAGDNVLLLFADPAFSVSDARVAGMQDDSRGSPDSLPPQFAALRGLERGGWKSFQRLHHSRDEALAISQLVRPEHRQVLLGFEATREAVLSEETASYRVLHFATHGILDSQQPRLSGLVLSLVDERGRPRNGVVRLHDIYSLDLAAELVVLSACQTALGKQLRGEGVLGLTRGFIHAGAENVIASLWSVDDEATAELMRQFYQGLFRDGLSPARALRQAQIQLLRDAPETRWHSEYFWASFVSYGDWHGSISSLHLDSEAL
ncbi:MAG: CHAT domain-containing protein [bacterium]|nr:CHAT domain-containing protein [bacterium]